MHKLVSLLMLFSIATQPVQSMYKSRTASRATQTTMPIQLAPEAVAIGGAVVVGAGLVYWLYRSNYKRSLKQAQDHLAAAQKQWSDIQQHFAPTTASIDTVASRTAAEPLYREIRRDKDNLGDLIVRTKRDAADWKGYNDYNHAQAAELISGAQHQIELLDLLTKKLDHHVAQFIFSEESVNAIADISVRYPVMYNALTCVNELAPAREFQKMLSADRSIVNDYAKDLQQYIDTYATYPDNQVLRAKRELEAAQHIQSNMTTIQTNLTALTAQYELANLYFRVDAEFRLQLTLMTETQTDALEKDIKGEHHQEKYPLIAYVAKIDRARTNLRAQAAKVPALEQAAHARALADELSELIKTVVNMPTYQSQKTEARADDKALADRRHQEQLAREAQAATDRRAREERETRERIARQDREATERYNQAMAEQQRRIARAKEQEAIAAREKAEAEQRKARAEEERVSLERERLRLEREKLNATQKPASTTININVKKKDHSKDDLI